MTDFESICPFGQAPTRVSSRGSVPRPRAQGQGPTSADKQGMRAPKLNSKLLACTLALSSPASAQTVDELVAKNIEAILKLEEDDERQLPQLHRVSHKVGWFVGTTYFVIAQGAFVLVWLLWNTSASPFS